MSASESKKSGPKTAKVVLTIIVVIVFGLVVMFAMYTYNGLVNARSFYEQYVEVLRSDSASSKYSELKSLCTKVLENRKNIELKDSFLMQSDNQLVYHAIDTNYTAYEIPIIADESAMQTIIKNDNSVKYVSVDYDKDSFNIIVISGNE